MRRAAVELQEGLKLARHHGALLRIHLPSDKNLVRGFNLFLLVCLQLEVGMF
jgi:hypothetical protein